MPEDSEAELDDDTQALLTSDFEIGHYIRERIVPRAVLYYTGNCINKLNILTFWRFWYIFCFLTKLFTILLKFLVLFKLIQSINEKNDILGEGLEDEDEDYEEEEGDEDDPDEEDEDDEESSPNNAPPGGKQQGTDPNDCKQQ